MSSSPGLTHRFLGAGADGIDRRPARLDRSIRLRRLESNRLFAGLLHNCHDGKCYEDASEQSFKPDSRFTDNPEQNGPRFFRCCRRPAKSGYRRYFVKELECAFGQFGSGFVITRLVSLSKPCLHSNLTESNTRCALARPASSSLTRAVTTDHSRRPLTKMKPSSSLGIPF